MNNQVELSVIIPIYNTGKYIEKCALSLLNQTKKDNIEFIFINDASQDNSIQQLEHTLIQFPDRKDQVRIIHNEKNKGLAYSRLKGLQEAKGEFIIFCDSDDWVEYNMYESLLSWAKQQSADIVISEYFENDSDRIEIQLPELSYSKDIILQKIFKDEIHSYWWNKLIRKQLIKSINPVFLENYNYWEDVMSVPRLIYLANKVEIFHEPLYHYNRSNQVSYTLSKWKPEFTENIIKVLEINQKFFNEHGIDCSYLILNGLFLLLESDYDLNNIEIGEITDKFRNQDLFKTKLDSKYQYLILKLWFTKNYKLARLLRKVKKKIKSC